MAIIIKCDPGDVGTDDEFTSEAVPIYENCELIPGDEAFVWWTAKIAGIDGLAMHGNLVEITHASAPRGLRVSLTVKIDAESPIRKLTKGDLAKYDVRKSGLPSRPDNPMHELCRKLLGHSLRKVTALDGNEAAYLREFFSFAASGPAKPEMEVAEETAMVEGGPIDHRTQKLIDHDLSAWAIEGLTDDQKIKVRRRAQWLADRYIRDRVDRGLLTCESCGFDPIKRVQGTAVRPRSLLDVHHKNPLDEGVRETTLQDFCLLCPNCHRFEHAVIRSENAA